MQTELTISIDRISHPHIFILLLSTKSANIHAVSTTTAAHRSPHSHYPISNPPRPSKITTNARNARPPHPKCTARTAQHIKCLSHLTPFQKQIHHHIPSIIMSSFPGYTLPNVSSAELNYLANTFTTPSPPPLTTHRPSWLHTTLHTPSPRMSR